MFTDIGLIQKCVVAMSLFSIDFSKNLSLKQLFTVSEKYFTEYPGVAQLVGRLVSDHYAASSSLATHTKSPDTAIWCLDFF